MKDFTFPLLLHSLMLFSLHRSELLLLLLLSRFSRVRLCATPYMAAHQAPPSLGFSRHEYWSGLPFPSPKQESESESEVAQSCLTLCNPMDSSQPGSSVHRISRQEYWSGLPFPSPTSIHDYWKNHNFVYKVMSLLFNMLSRLVIAFLPRSKRIF